MHTAFLVGAALVLSVAALEIPAGGQFSFVAPAGFPTSVFSSYWHPPSPTEEPQPVIYDPVLNSTYPANLTDPYNISQEDLDPIYFPKPLRRLSSHQQQIIINQTVAQIGSIASNQSIISNCTKCVDSLVAVQRAAQLAPKLVPDMAVNLCKAYKFHSDATCEEDFESTTFGAVWTQVLFFANVTGYDGQYICNALSSTLCPAPGVTALDTKNLFSKPKPKNAAAPKPSGRRVKVLHMSDFHLDPRYANTAIPAGQISLASPLYGAYACDTPYDLGLAALESIGPLTGTGRGKADVAWTVYTGDLVSHDNQNQLSRAYTEYTETAVYSIFQKYISGPVFAALGNHDSNPEAIDAPHSLPGKLGEQQSWNYHHVAGLWQNEGWISREAAHQARTHYGAYSIKNHFGLRVITFNSDFWYKSNFLNYINMTNPDVSGTFKFMIDELQAAEDAGERVWIVSHVLSGWDGSNPLPNPSNLFYQIIDRYSPHVIANVFFGHTHEDQVMIYYANNATVQSADTAVTPGWIGPSVTPLTNLNSGYRLYEVDTGTYDIYEAYTFYADVSSFPALNETGPTFKFEYNTREAYGSAAGWPADAPLNATFWHRVTEAMEKDTSLVSKFNTYQGKSSIKSPNCTSEACAEAKVCYMRSGSVALGRQCPQGYGSVQSAFSPPKK
ncbi:hypothetical protein KVT40_000309 [Elsinoe batatas]|uniref:Calcineurin-like phosphoesterase domain-containing protein n=1 Tax=Elsinoe batatas TaxID=2601811 RepID=A0A8K0PML2_9PEZI|nr:hypothetical protein KVT40_000309 [Elsinoe batatas]